MSEFSFTYRAFISYSHADHEWGVWLHRALERYRVPKRLAGAEDVRRLGRCFRDEEEMAAAHEIGPKIEAALKASDVLIVICSPRSAKSQWVNREIEAFKKLGREHRIFALIVDGVPHDPENECFPEALKTTLSGGAADPFAPDVRKFGREDAVLRLIAGMLDVGYDDLRQREVRRRRVEMLRAQALFASGLVLVAAALTGGYFAASNYVDASEKRSELFAREAERLFDEGDHAKAMLMALYGDPAAQAGWLERMFRPDGYADARSALARSLANNRMAVFIDAHRSGNTHRTSLAFSPDGQSILTGGGDGNVKLWNASNGELRSVLSDQLIGVSAVAYSPDGKMAAASEVGGRVAIWDVSNGQEVGAVEAFERLTSLAFSPDSQTLLGGSEDHTAKLWNTRGELLQTFAGHETWVNSVAFSPDGQWIVTGSGDGTAKLWSAQGGTPLNSLRAIIPTQVIFGGVRSVAFSPDGKLVLVGLENGDVLQWSVFEHSVEPAIKLGSSITSLSFSPDGTALVASSSDNRATIWSFPEFEPLSSYVVPPDQARGMGVEVTAAAFSPTSKILATGFSDGKVRLWATDSNEPIATLPGRRIPSADTGRDFLPVSVSTDGDAAVTVGDDGIARLWRATDERPVQEFTADGGIRSAGFMSDNRLVWTVSAWSADVWDVKTGQNRNRFALEGSSRAIAFLPDGSGVLVSRSGDRGLQLIRGDGDLIAFEKETVPENLPYDVSFSGDGSKLLTGAQRGALKIWDTRTGQLIRTLTTDLETFFMLALSADGTKALVGLWDGIVKLWDAEDGRLLGTFAGGQFNLEAMEFLPDGRHFLTAGIGNVKLWTIDGNEVFTIDDPNLVETAASSPDGAKIVTTWRSGRDAAFQSTTLHLIPSILFEPADKQARTACAQLKEIHFTAFSAADYAYLPLLDPDAPHPCAKVWGAGGGKP